MDEQATLRVLLRQVDHGPRKALTSAWLNAGTMFPAAALMFVALGTKTPGVSFLMVFSALLLGLFRGALSCVRVSARQWPFVEPHVTRESIVRRLAELESP